MKSISIIMLIILLLSNTVKGQDRDVSVDFIINGKQVELKDDFEIFFVITENTHKHIIKPTIKENSFKMPDLCRYDRGHIVFKYKNEVMALGENYLKYDQNMNWEIVLDKKPYSKEYHIPQANEKETKGIVYIVFNPLEEGEGTVTTISVIDFRKYFRESKKLIE